MPSGLVAAEDITASEDAIDQLASLFDEGAGHWVLGGGMSIAIHAGIYYRIQYDLDVLVGADNFSSLVSSAGQKGYSLCRRIFSCRVTSTLTIQLVRLIDVLQAIRSEYGRLELIKRAPAADSSTAGLLNIVDVCVYHRNDGQITRHDGKISLPESAFRGIRYITRSGRAINVVSLEYMKAVKSRRHLSTDLLDLQMIKQVERRSSREGGIKPEWETH